MEKGTKKFILELSDEDNSGLIDMAKNQGRSKKSQAEWILRTQVEEFKDARQRK